MMKIRKLLYTLGCKCTHETENPLHMITNEGVRFIVLKTVDGYDICEDELHPEAFRFRFGCHLKQDLTIQDVKKTIDFINSRKHKINEHQLFINKHGNEVLILNQRGFGKVINKLREIGVEIIEVFSDKIEFEWYEHICSYKNGTFYCGTKNIKRCDDIYKLDSNFLNDLVGKLTDEQLDRVGNLIDLYKDKYNHLLGQQVDMTYIDMFGTKLYRKNDKVLGDYVNLIVELQNTFQSGFLDMSSIGDATLSYILKGE